MLDARDVIGGAGLVLIAVGLALMSVPTALVVTGALLLTIAAAPVIAGWFLAGRP